MGFESLYIGATGMKTHGHGIENLANNLANVNTIGFKSTAAHFENLISDPVTTGGSSTGISQQGHGVRLSAIITDFTQGPALQGSADTDLAITGKGFFKVVSGTTTRYTRAGNFRFDSEGYLVDPHGFRVQGRRFAPPGSELAGGDITDIRLNIEEDDDGYQYFTVDPVATTSVRMSPNLGLTDDKSVVQANPFFSMLANWNANSDPPLSESSYGFSNSIRIYDSDGGSHELTVYFDTVDAANAQGISYYEFVVGIDPSEDGRTGASGAAAAGLLMAGTLSFNSSGQVENMSAYTQASGVGGLGLASWTPAAISEDGHPTFDVSFVSSNASTESQTIALNLGLYGATGSWESTGSAAAVGSNAANANGFASAMPDAFAPTDYVGAASVLYQDQNGYAKGYLQSINVDRNGVLDGQYSNGLNAEIFQVTLYTFNNPYGLYREGGNHFSSTTDSGDALEGSPGDYDAVADENDTELGLGFIQSKAIEASNVDMAEQFATMIVNERGFQANSKVIVTTDWLLQQAAALKR